MEAVKLLYQTHSPYARKVLVAAHELELADRIEVINHETSPTRRNGTVYALNPLGKVPVLICDDGTVLFDSNVICEYLDGLRDGSVLLPDEPGARLHALKLQALAQGISDAGIAARWESERRPEHLRWPAMHDAQVQKIAMSCDYLEKEIAERDAVRSGERPDVGDIALVTALSWIEFRRVYPFDLGRPRLSDWYRRLSLRPSMRATALTGETHD
jgi:glutathione S-transferase